MNKTCPVCGANFEPEPGFYFGAMFVSYAIGVAILGTVVGVLYLLGNRSDTVYLASFAVTIVLTIPYSFRYSRILFLYWFGGYRYQGGNSE